MRAGRLAHALPLLVGLLLGGGGWPPFVCEAAHPLVITMMVLGEPELEQGDEQIVQVTVRNTTSKPAAIGLRVLIRDENGRTVGSRAQKSITIAPYDEQRAYFSVKPPRRTGAYEAYVERFSADFKRRLPVEEPPFYAAFDVGRPAPRRPPPSKTQAAAKEPDTGPPDFRPPAGLDFEAADLVWENFNVSPSNLLVGDTGLIRAELRNIGGDIAREIAVHIAYFNTRIPNRRSPITDARIAALAPGEKLEMEFEFGFPDDALLGDYKVILDAFLGSDAQDADRTNNQLISEQVVKLSTIRLVFPDAGYQFEEAGLFLFRWESKKYQEFKVQIGVESNFDDAELFFDIPQGSKWTKDQEIVPLPGELPGMARGLMLREETGTVYWRVLGRSSEEERTGYSSVQSFTIDLEQTEPPPDETEAPQELLPEPADRT